MATTLGVLFIPVLYVVIESVIERFARREEQAAPPVTEVSVAKEEQP